MIKTSITTDLKWKTDVVVDLMEDDVRCVEWKIEHWSSWERYTTPTVSSWVNTQKLLNSPKDKTSNNTKQVMYTIQEVTFNYCLVYNYYPKIHLCCFFFFWSIDLNDHQKIYYIRIKWVRKLQNKMFFEVWYFQIEKVLFPWKFSKSTDFRK